MDTKPVSNLPLTHESPHEHARQVQRDKYLDYEAAGYYGLPLATPETIKIICVQRERKAMLRQAARDRRWRENEGQYKDKV